MALKKISGKVTGFQQETVVTGAQTNRTGMTSVNSHNEVNFRIDNKPTILKLKANVNLIDGENATAVGNEKKGVFHAVAIKNDETGVKYSMSIWPYLIVTLMLIIFGLFFSTTSIYMGMIFFLPSIIFIVGLFRNLSAKSLLDNNI